MENNKIVMQEPAKSEGECLFCKICFNRPEYRVQWATLMSSASAPSNEVKQLQPDVVIQHQSPAEESVYHS